MERLNWHPENHKRLTALADRGRGERLAVFDWDDTCMFGDSSDTFLRHQVFNLDFRMAVDRVAELLPDRVGAVDRVVVQGRCLSLSELKAVILSSLREMTLRRLNPEDLPGDPRYRDFVVAFLGFYNGLETTPGIGGDYAYRWLAGLQEGFTVAEVRQKALRLFTDMSRREIVVKTLKNARGDLGVTWIEGMRIYPEIRQLMGFLKERSFRIAVVTATATPIVASLIRAAAYPVDTLIGMSYRLRGEVLTGDFDDRYRVNCGMGKVENIRKFLGMEPVLVAGDGNGDVEMLTAFPETRLRLIINRQYQGKIQALYRRAAFRQDGYLLQNIDFNEGRFASG